MIPAQRAAWNIPAGRRIDVALYAHGGLTDERTAAKTASTWIELLKGAQVFPIFFMWESGILETIENEIRDWLRDHGRMPTGGPLEALDRFWSDRVEAVARIIAKSHWDELKENARLLTDNAQGGARLLFDRLGAIRNDIRLHVIGHSAGAIIDAHMIDRAITRDGWTIDSVSLMAPASRIDLFRERLLAHLAAGRIARMAQFHLSDQVEDNEGGMRVALLYKRSLLYMISNGLEESRGVAIQGMAKFFDADIAPLGLPNLQARVAPASPATGATKHGAFEDDAHTQQSVIANILGQPIPP